MSLEERWPCWRLRIAFASILFFLFEVTIGKQLPPSIVGIILGVGTACAVSSFFAIREAKLSAQVDSIRRAISASKPARSET